MKPIVVFLVVFVSAHAATLDLVSGESNIDVKDLNAESLQRQQQPLAKEASNYGPLYRRRYENRYIPYVDVGGYDDYRGLIDGHLGYGRHYNSQFSPGIFNSGLDLYSSGYNSYINNAPYSYGNYRLRPYNSLYGNHLASDYLYQQTGFGYNGYPASYYANNYANNYANSIVGGGFGGIGPAGRLEALPGREELGLPGFQFGRSIFG